MRRKEVHVKIITSGSAAVERHFVNVCVQRRIRTSALKYKPYSVHMYEDVVLICFYYDHAEH